MTEQVVVPRRTETGQSNAAKPPEFAALAKPLELRTELSKNGFFESRCALVLDACVLAERPGPEVPAYDSFVVEQLFAALNLGQRRSFIVRRNAGCYDLPAADLGIRGAAVDERRGNAEASARALHVALARLLAIRGDCGFVP